jgi:SAM-dependent methyltransferase
MPPEGVMKEQATQSLSGRCEAQEWMDEPSQPASDLAASLRDIQKVNRFLGGTAVTLRHLKRLLRDTPPQTPITLLDLATGSGDIPRAAVRWGRRHGFRFQIIALDFSPTVLETARSESKGYPEMEFVQGDARRTGYEDSSFDIVTCNMSLHHFGPEEAVQVLREMDRLSRYGFIVNDLRRSRWAWLGIWLLTRVLPANRLTRHDGPLSTLRAYTPSELRELAALAGLPHANVYTHLFSRMALVVEKKGETL